jgi:uncharacterized membrane protein YqjE
MIQKEESQIRQAPLTNSSTAELVARLADEAKALVKTEVALAKAELRTEWKDELKMASGFGVAAVLALVTVTMLFVAIALGLGQTLPEWAAALLVAAGTFTLGAIAGAIGWSYRVRKLLPRTQRTIEEDAQWAQRLT